jgi:hypothetical protein
MTVENGRAVEAALTKTQRDAVTAIRRFRHQRKVGSTWLVGDRRLSRRVISDLEKMRLVREVTAGGNPVLTYIGGAN